MNFLTTHRVAICIFSAIFVFGAFADARDSALWQQPSCSEMVTQEISAPTQPGVVYVIAADCKKNYVASRATGWVAPNGDVITARHAIIGEGTTNYLRTNDGVVIADNMLAHNRYDLLRIRPNTPLSTERLSLATVSVGEQGYALGINGNETIPANVSYLGQEQDDNGSMIDVYQGEIIPGYSGGPVINGAGQVVGITYARHKHDAYAYVVPISAAHDLLRAA